MFLFTCGAFLEVGVRVGGVGVKGCVFIRKFFFYDKYSGLIILGDVQNGSVRSQKIEFFQKNSYSAYTNKGWSLWERIGAMQIKVVDNCWTE